MNDYAVSVLMVEPYNERSRETIQTNDRDDAGSIMRMFKHRSNAIRIEVTYQGRMFWKAERSLTSKNPLDSDWH